MAEEQKQEEMELEVEVKEPEDTTEVDVVEDNSEDQFKSRKFYSKKN